MLKGAYFFTNTFRFFEKLVLLINKSLIICSTLAFSWGWWTLMTETTSFIYLIILNWIVYTPIGSWLTTNSATYLGEIIRVEKSKGGHTSPGLHPPLILPSLFLSPWLQCIYFLSTCVQIKSQFFPVLASFSSFFFFKIITLSGRKEPKK